MLRRQDRGKHVLCRQDRGKTVMKEEENETEVCRTALRNNEDRCGGF